MAEKDLHEQFTQLADLLKQAAALAEALSNASNVVGTPQTQRKLNTVNAQLGAAVTALRTHTPR